MVLNGTAAGTHLLKDIHVGLNNSNPTGFAALGNGRTDGINGDETWITNGTKEGTMLLKDINSIIANSHPSPVLMFDAYVNTAPTVMVDTHTTFTEKPLS